MKWSYLLVANHSCLIVGFPSAHLFSALLGWEDAFVKGLQLEKRKLVKEDNGQYS